MNAVSTEVKEPHVRTMISPQEWTKALAPFIPSDAAFEYVGIAARAYLTNYVEYGDMISTATLVEALFPIAWAKQSEAGMAARQRIVDALTNKYADRYTLAGCFIVAPPETKRIYGKRKTIRRRLWHPPVLPVTA